MATKYPTAPLILGLITDFFIRYFFLSIPSIILLIIGIWLKPCLYIALGLILLDLALCIIGWLKIKKTFETESDNPDFKAFQDSVGSHGWREGSKLFVEKQLGQHHSDSESD